MGKCSSSGNKKVKMCLMTTLGFYPVVLALICYDFSIQDKLENHATVKIQVWLAYLLLALFLSLLSFFIIPLISSSLSSQRLGKFALQITLTAGSLLIAIPFFSLSYKFDYLFFAFFFSGWQPIGVACWMLFLSFVSGVYYFFRERQRSSG